MERAHHLEPAGGGSVIGQRNPERGNFLLSEGHKHAKISSKFRERKCTRINEKKTSCIESPLFNLNATKIMLIQVDPNLEQHGVWVLDVTFICF